MEDLGENSLYYGLKPSLFENGGVHSNAQFTALNFPLECSPNPYSEVDAGLIYSQSGIPIITKARSVWSAMPKKIAGRFLVAILAGYLGSLRSFCDSDSVNQPCSF